MDEVTNHVNMEGFHLRKSTIPGYSKEHFNLQGYLVEHRDCESLSVAAVSVRSAASVALQAQAAVAVASSDLLQGKSAFFSLSASNLPLASVISSAISPFPCIALLFLFLLLP